MMVSRADQGAKDEVKNEPCSKSSGIHEVQNLKPPAPNGRPYLGNGGQDVAAGN